MTRKHAPDFDSAPWVEILLATFNGERFLRAQIESILVQTYPRLRILARDDGSSDGSPAILAEYARAYPDRFRIAPADGPSGSAQGNFLRLLKLAGQETTPAEYLGFADQDDVWLPDKIARSLAAMHELERSHKPQTPLLVFGDLRVVDEHLDLVAGSFWQRSHIRPAAIRQLRRLLIQNVVTGSTSIVNQPLAALGRRMPPEAYMHDWWLALVACCLGAAAWISEPTTLYRQHQANVLGSPAEQRRGIPKWRYHRERRKMWEAGERQAEAFLRVYGTELKAADRKLIEAFVRCEHSGSGLVRAATFLANRFFVTDLRTNLALAWYLLDMAAAKQVDS